MRGKRKKRAALIMAAALWIGMAGMAVSMQAMAAQQAQPVVVATTQRCSIWSAPVTAEENRVKYVDEGYQITVYPEVVQSAAGDGKTFYRTVRGAYVLCKCVTGVENGTPAGGSGIISGSAPTMPVLPAFDNTANVVTWRQVGGVVGNRNMGGFDAEGNQIREEIYVDGKDLLEIVVTEYEPEGRWIKTLYYEYYDFTNGGYSLSPVERILRFEEYDAAGNLIRSTRFDAETGRATNEYVYEQIAGRDRQIRQMQYLSDGKIDSREYGYDAAGNKILEKRTEYRADGTIYEYTINEYNAAGNLTGTKSVFYQSDGTTVKEYWISEYNENGQQTKFTEYNGDGTVKGRLF